MSGIVSKRRWSKHGWGRLAGLTLLAASVAGCSQMTKHSNMLVFGTNTSVGLNVGKDASQTPTIQIGINRQEVALVPLLANTGYIEGEGANGKKYAAALIPCPANEDPGVPPEGCKFVGSSTVTVEEKDKEKVTTTELKDAYSTLASFGTKTQANGEGASASVAQYFATGVAAQRLAENGGANVVQAESKSAKVAEAEAKTAASEADKAKAEEEKLRLLKEQADQEYLDGRKVALIVLGNDETKPVDQSKRENLAEIMGPGCDDNVLKTYPQGTVQAFLDALGKKQNSCFDNLIP